MAARISTAGVRHLDVIARKHTNLIAQMEHLFGDGDYAAFVLLTPGIKTMANYYVISSQTDHKGAFIQQAMFLFSRLAVANEELMNMVSAMSFCMVTMK